MYPICSTPWLGLMLDIGRFTRFFRERGNQMGRRDCRKLPRGQVGSGCAEVRLAEARGRQRRGRATTGKAHDQLRRRSQGRREDQGSAISRYGFPTSQSTMLAYLLTCVPECSAMKNRGVNEAFTEAARVALQIKTGKDKSKGCTIL